MKCTVHDCEMDYVPDDGEIPEHWHCERCRVEEEAAVNDAFDDGPEPSRCGFCGSEMFDGYCWASPDGNHHHDEE
jgi:hypothetical protein